MQNDDDKKRIILCTDRMENIIQNTEYRISSTLRNVDGIREHRDNKNDRQECQRRSNMKTFEKVAKVKKENREKEQRKKEIKEREREILLPKKKTSQ